MAWNHSQRTKNEDRNEWFRAQVTAQLHWQQSRRLTLLCWRKELQQLPFWIYFYSCTVAFHFYSGTPLLQWHCGWCSFEVPYHFCSIVQCFFVMTLFFIRQPALQLEYQRTHDPETKCRFSATWLCWSMLLWKCLILKVPCRRALKEPCRRAPKVPCRRALKEPCRRALKCPVEGPWKCTVCFLQGDCSYWIAFLNATWNS